MERVHDLLDLGDHARHQPLGGLIEQDDLGLEHHRARDREHLLLAARERPARLVAPLPQDGEVGVHLLEQRLATGGRDPGTVEPGSQIFEHREQAEDPSLLRHPGDAEPGQPVRRHALQVASFEGDPAGGAPRHPHDGLERRRLAHTVAPEESDDLARAHLNRHAVKHVGFAVVRVDVFEDQHQVLR